MQFNMTKSKLVSAVSRMNEIATKGIRSEFESAGRITISSKGGTLLFSTTNGNMFAKLEITKDLDSKLSVQKEGTFTIDSSMANRIFNLVGGKNSDNHIINISLEEKSLHIKDADSKMKKPQIVKMQTFNENHDIKIKKEDGFKFDFETDMLLKGISNVSGYASKAGYNEDVMYYMVCIHFLPEEVRFVCGDGLFFGVSCKSGKFDTGITDQKGVKYVIPADQASVLSNVLLESSASSFVFTSSKQVQVRTKDGLEVEIRGIPTGDFLPYETFTFVDDKVDCVFDVKTEDFKDAMALVMSCRDKEMESQTLFHSSQFLVDENNELQLSVSEGRYQCDTGCSGKFTNFSTNSFTDCYPALFLNNVARASRGEYLRFKCVKSQEIMVVESLDLDESLDKNKLHNSKDQSNKMLFFFAAARDEE